MKEYTPTHFRNNTSEVFNEVQSSGCVQIKSKSRPDMLLMTKEELNRIIERDNRPMNFYG